MPCFQLPELALSINATNTELKRALCYAFALCKQTENTANIEVFADTVTSDEFESALPAWLATLTVNLQKHQLPVIYYAENGEIACGGAYADRRFLAWTVAQQHCIRFLSEDTKCGATLGYFHALLTPLLREIYLSQQGLLLHAAGMQIGDKGILLIAPSGGGKTTTTIALLREQAKMLADDLVVLIPTTKGIAAHGIPKHLNLRKGTIEAFEELQTETGMSEKLIPDKQPFTPYNTYGEACLLDKCDIHAAYFINLSTDGPRVEPTDAAQAMNKLALAHTFTSNQLLNGNSSQLICDAISRIRCFNLDTGDAPKQLGKWLVQHVQSTLLN